MCNSHYPIFLQHQWVLERRYWHDLSFFGAFFARRSERVDFFGSESVMNCATGSEVRLEMALVE